MRMGGRGYRAAVGALQAVALGGVALQYVPLRYAVVTEEVVCIGIHIRAYAIGQGIDESGMVIESRYKSDTERVVVFFMHNHGMFHSRFVAGHGVVGVQRQQHYFR